MVKRGGAPRGRGGGTKKKILFDIKKYSTNKKIIIKRTKVRLGGEGTLCVLKSEFAALIPEYISNYIR